MTKLISIFVIVLVLFAGWRVYKYYQQVEDETQKTGQTPTTTEVRPEDLPGLPNELYSSYQKAQQGGATGLRNWLNAYGAKVKDPRKAWIEIDYSLAIFRDDPNEARRVFNGVKQRTETNSPVYPRVRQLEKTFE
jgi:hypothetical protein